MYGRKKPTVVSSNTTTRRTTALSDVLRIKSTRLVLYLPDQIMSIFITDDLTPSLPSASPRTLRIRPSSYRKFGGNPSSVKACVLGNPKADIPGGFRLDKEGLGIEVQDAFEDLKWVEIDFATETECKTFLKDIHTALQERRRERIVVDELKKKAERGVRVGEW
jgi:hypothetical protein